MTYLVLLKKKSADSCFIDGMLVSITKTAVGQLKYFEFLINYKLIRK